MAILVHRYDAPDRFVAGTVGQPGERTFFLQAREGNRITSVELDRLIAASPAQARTLLDLGCDIGQGTGIAAPMPAGQVTGWVRDYRGVFALVPAAGAGEPRAVRPSGTLP